MKTPKGIVARVFIVIISFLFLAVAFAACGGGGGGGIVFTGPRALGDVKALFALNGADWNDYVQGGNITNATDTACNADTDTACVHAGEVRMVELTGLTDCTGITATDSLGAFEWTCDDSSGTAIVISNGLSSDYGLANLIDFVTPGWKDNGLTVRKNATVYGRSSSKAWWSNPVQVDNDGGLLEAAGTIYVVTNDALTPANGGYIINAPGIALVGNHDIIINGPGDGTGSYVISADGSSEARDFLWIEGSVDAQGDDMGIYLNIVRFSTLRNIGAYNASAGNLDYGIRLYSSSYNTLTNIGASGNNGNGIDIFGSNSNDIRNITSTNNGIHGITLDMCTNNILSNATSSNNGGDGVYLETASDNNLSHIASTENGNHGVYLLTSSGNTLDDVTTSDNVNYGLLLYISSTNNTLSNITAFNQGYGIMLSVASGTL